MNFVTEWWWPLVLLGGGFLGGLIFMMADHLLFSRWYKTYLDPVRPTVLTRSLLFLLAYWPLTLFVLTSSGLVIGQGMVLGIGAILGWEMWQHHRDLEGFKNHFQIPVASRLTAAEITYLTYAWLTVVSIAAVLVIL